MIEPCPADWTAGTGGPHRGATAERDATEGDDMRRQATVVIGVIGLALTLGTGAAQAAPVQDGCAGPTPRFICGNDQDNNILGTAGRDTMYGKGGSDRLYGGDGDDSVNGDGAANPHLDGDDRLFGNDGNDTLFGYGGSDLLVGGPGRDHITAWERALAPVGQDTVKAGAGNDTIEAADGFKDTIACGPGRDTVTYDEGLDTLTGCEIKHPV
jgi:Ca2+-binding RTX toxin-like protein